MRQSKGDRILELSLRSIQNKENWKGYHLPEYDPVKIAENTAERPQWMHFGSGNIFRIFPAVICQRLIEQGEMDTGIVCCEGYDDEIITKCFRPYDNLTIAVTLNPDGKLDKEIVASMSDSLTMLYDREQVAGVMKEPSLQMVSFTITEKGYSLRNANHELTPAVAADMEAGPKDCKTFMAQLTAMCIERGRACKKPLSLVSMDNCSHNGEKLRSSVLAIVKAWKEKGLVPQEFEEYVSDEARVSFPWSMIDKITPRPAEVIEKQLSEAGVEDMAPVVTSRNTYIAPFVNAEIPQYLVVEDRFPNGRPSLDKAGVYLTTRDTVNMTERMKVTTCLNPLHTALAVYGCLLGYTSIAAEMGDGELKKLVEHIGYDEGMPVVTDPGIISPMDFIHEVIDQRLPNPFIPDTPQRIATDTSQKVGIRFGETIKSYVASDKLDVKDLTCIPLALAGWLRYLLGVDDKGQAMTVSADPMLTQLQEQLLGVKAGDPDSYKGQLKEILCNPVVFGVNLYEAGLGDKVEAMFAEMLAGPGAVRATLKKYVQ